MMNILWSGLNIGVLLGFSYLAFRAIWLLKRHTGLGAALLFGLGLLLTVSSKSDSATAVAPPQNLLTTSQSDVSLGNGSVAQSISLGPNTLKVIAEYSDTAEKIRPRSLYATVTGLMLGHEWRPVAGTLESQGRQLRYQIVVSHTWLLLGVPVFSSTTQFAGVTAVAEA